MSAGRPGVLVFDPSRTAVAGAKYPGHAGADPSGGGAIAGPGTYYSGTTETGAGGWSDISDQFHIAGTLVGVLTPEFSNSEQNEILKGTDQWNSYLTESYPAPSITIPAVASGTNEFGVALARYPHGRVRYKFVVSSGAGTIKDRRVVKAS